MLCYFVRNICVECSTWDKKRFKTCKSWSSWGVGCTYNSSGPNFITIDIKKHGAWELQTISVHKVGFLGKKGLGTR